MAVVFEFSQVNDFIKPRAVKHLALFKDVIVTATIDVDITVETLDGINLVGCEVLHGIFCQHTSLGFISQRICAIGRPRHCAHSPADNCRDSVRVVCRILANRIAVIQQLELAEDAAILRIGYGFFAGREGKNRIRRTAFIVGRNFQNLFIRQLHTHDTYEPFAISLSAGRVGFKRGFRPRAASSCCACRDGQCSRGRHCARSIAAARSLFCDDNTCTVYSYIVDGIDGCIGRKSRCNIGRGLFYGITYGKAIYSPCRKCHSGKSYRIICYGVGADRVRVLSCRVHFAGTANHNLFRGLGLTKNQLCRLYNTAGCRKTCGQHRIHAVIGHDTGDVEIRYTRCITNQTGRIECLARRGYRRKIDDDIYHRIQRQFVFKRHLLILLYLCASARMLTDSMRPTSSTETCFSLNVSVRFHLSHHWPAKISFACTAGGMVGTR